MGILFDGRSYASQKLESLMPIVSNLKAKGIDPKLVSILIGSDEGSKLYLSLKKKAGEKVGACVEVKEFPGETNKNEIIDFIHALNSDPSVHGIMVQLPFPPRFSKEDRDEIINSISSSKDVDGLRDESNFLTPVVMAVVGVVQEGEKALSIVGSKAKITIIGSLGFEGKKIAKEFQRLGYVVDGVDIETEDSQRRISEADIVVSVTGSAGIINSPTQVKSGVILVDVGYPKGDIVADKLIDKAGFISPVPGGVGPVTIAALIENLVNSAKK